MNLSSPLVLPNGAVVPNRIGKAAMEENMCDANHAPSTELLKLYEAWAQGGAGLLITGNVMVDRRGMTGPAEPPCTGGELPVQVEPSMNTSTCWPT